MVELINLCLEPFFVSGASVKKGREHLLQDLLPATTHEYMYGNPSGLNLNVRFNHQRRALDPNLFYKNQPGLEFPDGGSRRPKMFLQYCPTPTNFCEKKKAKRISGEVHNRLLKSTRWTFSLPFSFLFFFSPHAVIEGELT